MNLVHQINTNQSTERVSQSTYIFLKNKTRMTGTDKYFHKWLPVTIMLLPYAVSIYAITPVACSKKLTINLVSGFTSNTAFNLTAKEAILANLNFVRIVSLTLFGLLLSSCVSRHSEQQQSLLNFSQLINGFDESTRIADLVPNPPQRLPQIRSNASGITWDPYRQQFLIIQNNSTVIYRYDRDFAFIDKARATGNIHQDTEGLTAINGKNYLIVTEANMAYRIQIGEGYHDKKFYDAKESYQLSPPPKQKNKGFEAVAFRPTGEQREPRIYAGEEGSKRYPDAKMRVVYFTLNKQSNFFNRSHSYLDSTFHVVEPFNAEAKFKGVITDISGMVFDPTGRYLIIVSQESSKAIQVDPENGDIISQLSLKGAPAYEGVTIGPDGELVFVSEKNWIQVFHHNSLIKN